MNGLLKSALPLFLRKFFCQKFLNFSFVESKVPKYSKLRHKSFRIYSVSKFSKSRSREKEQETTCTF